MAILPYMVNFGSVLPNFGEIFDQFLDLSLYKCQKIGKLQYLTIIFCRVILNRLNLLIIKSESVNLNRCGAGSLLKLQF